MHSVITYTYVGHRGLPAAASLTTVLSGYAQNSTCNSSVKKLQRVIAAVVTVSTLLQKQSHCNTDALLLVVSRCVHITTACTSSV
jgi:hypothetical protein